MVKVGLYAETISAVRQAGGVAFPTNYGVTYQNATDQFTFDMVPSPDRGPYVVTGITGLPFVTTNLTRSDAIQLRSSGNDLQFAPFLASAFTPGLQLPQGIDSCLLHPILVTPGSSFFIRNFQVGSAAPVIVSGQITVTGFHTDAIGADYVSRQGQPWVIPIINDHNATLATDIQREIQFEAGSIQASHLVEGFQTIPLLFSVRIRGVEISQGATVFGDPAFAFNTPTSTGNELFCEVAPGDGFTLRTVYPAPANNVYKANLWVKRIYRQPNLNCN